MSAVKFKIVGLFRRLLHRADQEEINGPNFPRPLQIVVPPSPPAATPVLTERSVPKPTPTLAAPPPPPAPANLDQIQLALQPILSALPMELSGKVVTTNTAGMEISIPLDKVLPQLATGLVRISYGELRHLAPGVFAEAGSDQDAKSVILPLDQVLPRISPALLARRAVQKQVGIADEVTSPFSREGQNPSGAAEPANPPALVPASPSLKKEIVPSGPELTPPSPPTLNPRWKTPALSGGRNGRGNGSSKAAGKGGNGAATPAKLDPPPEPASPRTPATATAGSQKAIVVPLSTLLEGWPGVLRVEIEMLNLAQAQVALPPNLIEPALKRGKVVFTWRDLRSWIQNVPAPVSVHDNVKLELPLKVLAPLFFGRTTTGTTTKKVAATNEIPNVFFDMQQPAGARPAAPKEPAVPQPTTSVPVRPPAAPSSEPDIKLLEIPDAPSRGVTPADIVSRAMELPGVAGALIALADGLKVASRIPVGLNSDTLAAFLPQIFSRVNQSSRELRLGEVNNLCFTVGRVPWSIFRVNSAYFAAFGRANETLPTPRLAALAAELDHAKQ
jgi:predicted regulator of Ras-like GTPase activity (Roadblock/LC7/MglB family)